VRHQAHAAWATNVNSDHGDVLRGSAEPRLRLRLQLLLLLLLLVTCSAAKHSAEAAQAAQYCAAVCAHALVQGW
jgi:hypothetical protein